MGTALPLRLPMPNPTCLSGMSANVPSPGEFYRNALNSCRNPSFIIINSPFTWLSRQEEPPGRDLHMLVSLWLGTWQALHRMTPIWHLSSNKLTFVIISVRSVAIVQNPTASSAVGPRMLFSQILIQETPENPFHNCARASPQVSTWSLKYR